MTAAINIFWFRRDLRVEDNHGLYAALTSGLPVLPVFIYDQDILDELPKDDARVTFINHWLSEVDESVKPCGKSVATFYGKPVQIFEELTQNHVVDSVFTNQDYEPNAVARDKKIEQFLESKQVKFRTLKDHVVFEKSEVVKPSGEPYIVFTPYSNKWKALLKENEIVTFPSEDHLQALAKHSYPFLTLSDIGFEESNINAPALQISPELIRKYVETRNFPDKPTTLLGVHLRFGTISIRKLVKTALDASEQTFLSELIWREFFMQILWHYPFTVTTSFRPQYETIKWRNNEEEFRKWCHGDTGYPLVDAGMRELNTTGFMHNRVRMIVAGFLCKHLLIDWRWGEAYFATKLLDYEQASNVGNWQWAAGSGVDAAPYFRIFNPSEQLRKFDPKMVYVRKWVPEIDELTYPRPIVDHAFARERCIATYKTALYGQQ